MKAYYLFAPVEPSCTGPASGVERKVRSQYKALSEYMDCELIILDPVRYSGSAAEKVKRRLPFMPAWRKWRYNGEFDDADVLYIRQVYHDGSFARYLKDIRKANPGIRILYEIPTYPYDLEKRITLSNLPFILKEREGRRRAAAYMDRIITFYGQKKIWGVPCISLMNGFDFSEIILPKRKKTEKVELISVSATAPWHGYDRVIEGIRLYYQRGGKEAVSYHLVGDILPEHQRMVRKYGLEDRVIFHGRIFGKELEDLYRQCFLGFDVLGGHRKDYPVSSSLKSREYAAFGLPIITSSPVDYLPADYRYQLLLPYDDSPADMDKILSFYHAVYDDTDPETVSAQVRSFARARCDIKVTMRPVVDYVLTDV